MNLADIGHPSVPPTAEEWLEALSGPALITIPGRDEGPTRALSVLLHGNEPSGFRALHRYLREGREPARRTVCFVGAVDAAKAQQRYLADRRDLNRCFLAPSDDVDGRLAASYLEVLEREDPEALVDLHNNTGHNPAYGVLVDEEPRSYALVELFAPRGVINHLCLGTLIEAWQSRCPSVVVECGQSGDMEADEVAFAGLCRYLEADELPVAPRELMLYRNTVRFTLREGLVPVFANEPAGALTLRPDVERFNFREVPAGTSLGWHAGEELPLLALGADGHDHAPELLELRGGELRARQGFRPIMMTTNPEVVRADCLCYLVADFEG